MRILSTRKLAPNQKQFLLNAGLSVVEADFIEVSTVSFDLADINENLIFTSQNAVRAVAQHAQVQEIRRNPVFCVGDKTADLLDEVGFTVIEIADNAQELANRIVERYRTERFTFFAGNIRRDVLPDTLRSAAVKLDEIEVYQTVQTPVKIESGFDAVLFFSPSGVASFLSENQLTDEVCFCIGQTTADELKNNTNNIVIANKPSVENVIIQCINHFK